MKRAHSYLWSTILAILPLALLVCLNHFVLQPRNIGLDLDMPWEGADATTTETDTAENAMQGSLESTSPATPDDATVGNAAQENANEPKHLFVLGASPSLMGLRHQDTAALQQNLQIQTTIMAKHGWPMTCYRDALELIMEHYPIDMLVMEFYAVSANDEHLVFRTETFGEQRGWSGFPDDPEIVESIFAVTRAEKGKTKVGLEANLRWRQNKNAERAPRFLSQLNQRVEQGNRHRNSPPDREINTDVTFRSSLDVWDELSGTPDISKFDRPWLQTNHVSMTSIHRVAEFCREHDIQFAVYVPPRAPDLRNPEPDRGQRQKAATQTSLAELEITAAALGFPIFNYDAWTDDFDLYRDSVHLAPVGVEAFSPQFFENLQNYLQSNDQGFEVISYTQK